MNKYIKTDIQQGLDLLKVGIMNALHDIETGAETDIELGDHVPFSLVVECAEQRGWKEDKLKDWDTNGWECDCWYFMITPNNKLVEIWSSLWKGQKTRIRLSDETD